MATFIANVKAVLDDSELVRLDNLCNKDRTANVKIKLSGDANQLNNVNRNIENIRNNANNPITLTMNHQEVLGHLQDIEDQLLRIQAINLNLGGNGRTRNANSEITRQFNLASKYQKRMAKQLSSFELLDTDRELSSVNTILNQYQNAQREYSRILNQYGDGFTDSQHTQLREFEIDTEQTLERVRSKLQDSISTSLTDGTFDKKLSSLGQIFREIGDNSTFLRRQIDGVTDALDEMRIAVAIGDFDGLLNAFNNFNHRYTSADNTFKVLKAERREQQRVQKEQQKEQDDALKAQQKARKLDADKGILNSDIDLWSKNNFEASERLKTEIDDIRTAIANCNNEADFSNIKQQFQQLQKDVKNQDIVDSITKSGKLGEFDLEFKDLKSSLNQIREVKDELKDAFSDLSNAKNELNDTLNQSPNDIQKILEDYQKYQDAVEKYNAEYSKAKQKQDEDDADKNLERQKKSLKNDIKTWLKENSAAAKEFGSELNDIYSKIDNCNKAQLDGLKDEFNDITEEARIAGKATQSFGDKLKSGITEEFTQLFSISRLFDYGVDAIRDMYNQVVEVDSAMVNLKKVTDETDATYNKFLDDAADNAIALGRSMSSYIEQTADWTKLGYTLKEAQELSKLSSVYANVAEIDNSTAVSDMVTAMKAFNIETANAVQITDALNELGK